MCLMLKAARHLHIPHAGLAELETGDLCAPCLIIQLPLAVQGPPDTHTAQSLQNLSVPKQATPSGLATTFL